MNVYKAINDIQAELAKIGIAKGRVNQAQNFKFRSIDDVFNALSPLLAAHKLCILPRMISRTSTPQTNSKGTVMNYVCVEAEFDFIHSGDTSKHTIKTFGEAMDSGDKATNKAMSAAYKYAALQAFAIPTEADNDADAGLGEEPELTKEQIEQCKLDLEACKSLTELQIQWGKMSHAERVALAEVKDKVKGKLK